MRFIAHIRESDQEIQSVEQHLLEVKKLAEYMGDKIGVTLTTGYLRKSLAMRLFRIMPIFTII